MRPKSGAFYFFIPSFHSYILQAREGTLLDIPKAHVGKDFEEFSAVVSEDKRGMNRGRGLITLLSLLGVCPSLSGPFVICLSSYVFLFIFRKHPLFH